MESNFTIEMYGKNSTKSVLEPAVSTYYSGVYKGQSVAPWGFNLCSFLEKCRLCICCINILMERIEALLYYHRHQVGFNN